MKSRIAEILQEIESKKLELFHEYEKMRKKYDFSFKKGKIIFSKKAEAYQRRFRVPTLKYINYINVRHCLSMPFIYGMFIPAIFLDISLFIYQQTAMRLYRIPLVRRRDYIELDRTHLNYLNTLQKINCIYCSYMNGLFSFAVEVAGRTEKYWCPIKAARRKNWQHDWEEHFADYGDPEWFKQIFNSNKEFFQKEKKKSSK